MPSVIHDTLVSRIKVRNQRANELFALNSVLRKSAPHLVWRLEYSLK